ncbi:MULTISPECIES: hypothetical protein [unclassified Nocardia]|uniref:hypothetical protein n=1 Tax=unclassified Nocardia TaxID=2637762 RepID=UPI0033ABCC42
MDFYTTAAQVIPVLLIVATLESRLLSWAAREYQEQGMDRLWARLVLSAIGASLVCEGVALVVILVDREWLTTCVWVRLAVLGGCLAALATAWRGGHLVWVNQRDNPPPPPANPTVP